jgi:putative transposase
VPGIRQIPRDPVPAPQPGTAGGKTAPQAFSAPGGIVDDERAESGERRAQATHPAKKKPGLMADGPNQVWSWDITKLRGPARGIWFLLYVIIDIYSRKAVRWETWPIETGILAKEFIEHAIEDNGGARPQAVHADRGTPHDQ